MTAVLVLLSVGVAGAQEITVPAGFRIDVFAEKLGGARGLAVDPDGVVLASITAQGRVVALPAPRGGRRATDVVTVVKDLDLPHGLVVRHGHIYVAETGRIVRYRYRAATQTAVEPTVVVDGLPHGAHHWTRSIAFGPDDKPYVAIGSSCDVCEERDPRRAAIVRYNADGSGEERFARGLRNPVRPGLPAAGYGIARVRFRAGRATGIEAFSTGWRQGERIIGRPVDLAIGRDGSVYVSDDHADRVHRVSYDAR